MNNEVTLLDNELIRGDTRTVQVTFKQADGTSYDLTGATAYLTINRSKNPTNDDSAALQKTKTSFDNPTSGIVSFKLTSTDTNLTPGNYWFDVQLVDAEGNKLSRKGAEITVIPDITRS